jgi:glyoxylase-like metal-dependent hydrolase (beta-lactamase superfamily II)
VGGPDDENQFACFKEQKLTADKLASEVVPSGGTSSYEGRSTSSTSKGDEEIGEGLTISVAKMFSEFGTTLNGINTRLRAIESRLDSMDGLLKSTVSTNADDVEMRFTPNGWEMESSIRSPPIRSPPISSSVGGHAVGGGSTQNLQRAIRKLGEVYGGYDAIPLQNAILCFERDLENSESYVLRCCSYTKESSETEDLAQLNQDVDAVLKGLGFRPKTYNGGYPGIETGSCYKICLGMVVTLAQKYREHPEDEPLEKNRFAWHSLSKGLDIAKYTRPRRGQEAELRPDWHLPKLVLCHADDENEMSINTLTDMVADAIDGSVDDGRYEVSCFRFTGTLTDVGACFPNYPLPTTARELPYLIVVNEYRSIPDEHNSCVGVSCTAEIYKWITSKLTTEHVHIVLGAAMSVAMAQQLSHDVRLALLAYSGANINEVVLRQLLREFQTTVPIGGDSILVNQVFTRKQIQLRQTWVKFDLMLTPTREEFENECRKLKTRISSRQKLALQNQSQDTLVLVGHGNSDGFLLRSTGGSYEVDDDENSLSWKVEGDPQEEAQGEEAHGTIEDVYLHPRDVSDMVGTVGDSLSVVVVTCHPALWKFHEQNFAVTISQCEGTVNPSDAAQTWLNVAEATLHRWKRAFHKSTSTTNALVEEAIALATFRVNDIACEELVRDRLPVKTNVPADKCAFLNLDETVGLMCWPADDGDTYSLTIKNHDGHFLHLVIDSGRCKPFKKFVWPHIRSLYKNGGKIDGTILTHVDQDHIGGMLAWANYNRNQRSKQSPTMVRSDITIVNAPQSQLPSHARTINDLERLIKSYIQTLRADDTNVIHRAYRGDVLAPDLAGSGKKMSHLYSAAEVGVWERDFGVTLHIVHPTHEAVSTYYDELDGKTLEDKSEGLSWANIHGIVLLLEYRTPAVVLSGGGGGAAAHMPEQHHRMLFCGDARDSDILCGLEELGILPKDSEDIQDCHISKNNPLALLTVPHHGSKSNISPTSNFFSRLPAKVYTISSSGRGHDHPHAEVLHYLATAIATSDGPVFDIEVRFSHAYSKRHHDASDRVDFFENLVTEMNLTHVTVSCTLDDTHPDADTMLSQRISF